VADLEF